MNNKRKCDYCREEIMYDAIICPHCKKKQNYYRIIDAIFVIVSAFIILYIFIKLNF